MDLDLSDEQLALRDTVRRCLAGGGGWGDLAALGALGVLAPGSGMGVVDAAVVAEELGRARLAGPWAPTAVAGVLALAAAGDGSGRVERAAAGALRLAVAVGGPGTVAVGAAVADEVLVPVDGRLVAVPAGPASVEAVDALDADVGLGAVADRVDGDDLGPFGDDDLARVRDALVVALAADALGAAAAVHELAIAYAKERHQFGRPIGSFQAVQHLCVGMLETVELVRGGVLHAAWACDDPGVDAAERGLAAQRLLASADRLASVADTAIQVFGGIGYTWEHDAHRWLRRLLSWWVPFGPPHTHRIAVARGALL